MSRPYLVFVRVGGICMQGGQGSRHKDCYAWLGLILPGSPVPASWCVPIVGFYLRKHQIHRARCILVDSKVDIDSLMCSEYERPTCLYISDIVSILSVAFIFGFCEHCTLYIHHTIYTTRLEMDRQSLSPKASKPRNSELRKEQNRIASRAYRMSYQTLFRPITGTRSNRTQARSANRSLPCLTRFCGQSLETRPVHP